MKKRGFTLIELLAVIIVLAIIALIATPIVMNVVKKAKKESLKQSTTNLISAAEKFYMNEVVDKNQTDSIFYVKDGKLDSDLIQIKGELPNSGVILVKKDGKVALALKEDKTCYKKGLEESTVTMTDNIDNCNLMELRSEENTTLLNQVLKEEVKNYNNTLQNGLIKYDDETIYFVGNVENNYIWFGGFIFRIVGIDQTGNIKLATNESLTTLASSQEDNKEQASLKKSYIGKWLTEEFLPRFSREKDLLNISYDTPDINSNNSTWYSKVSLLNVNDVTKLGGFDKYSSTYKTKNYYSTNTNYFKNTTYLALADIVYKTPGDTNSSIRIRVNTDIVRFGLSEIRTVKPVVTISGDMKVTKGNGTATNPYVIEGETEATKISEMHVGEYVTLANNEVAKVMDINQTGVKFILDEPLEKPINVGFAANLDNIYTTNQNYVAMTKYFDGTTTGISLLKYLDTNDHIWYSGKYAKGLDYNNVKSSQATYKGAYGYPVAAEIFTGSDTNSKLETLGTILTSTKYTGSNITMYVGSEGVSHFAGAIEGASVRPVFYLKKDIKVVSGSGQYNDPYVLEK